MNDRMYEHPATQANLGTLRARGAQIVEPDSGRLASHGEHGVGRLADPVRILAACEAVLGAVPDHRTPMAGAVSADLEPTPVAGTSDGDGQWSALKVLITAGGTREPIDGVRFVGNSSSGRMGARARRGRTRAWRRGDGDRRQRVAAGAGRGGLAQVHTAAELRGGLRARVPGLRRSR